MRSVSVAEDHCAVGAFYLITKRASVFCANKTKFLKGGHLSVIKVSCLVNDDSMKTPAAPTHISAL